MAMQDLTVAVPMFYRYLHDLMQRPPGPVRCPVGVSRYTDHLELLGAVPGSAVGREVLISWTETFQVPHVLPTDCAGVLLLGQDWQRGRARGAIRLPSHTLAPLHRLRLVGPGMHVIALQEAMPGARSQTGPLQRWSRTIGALGQEAWQRLIGLRYAIIGVGRTGSKLALALVRQGVSHLTLIDSDHVELHNLGEMDGVNNADLGRPKVEALATVLAAQASTQLDVVPVPTPSPACRRSTPPRPVMCWCPAWTTTVLVWPRPQLRQCSVCPCWMWLLVCTVMGRRARWAWMYAWCCRGIACCVVAG